MESSYTDVMVDIETTGVAPDDSAIIQIAAVRFNLEERTVDSTDMFNRCLSIPPKRFWDEGTRHWWSKQKASVFQEITSRAEDPATVVQALADWAGYKGLTFWAKPSHFDFMFVESYFKQFNIPSPFHFRNTIDQNSFIRGLGRSSNLPKVQVEMAGDAHNAIFDVLNQIGTVFAAMDQVHPYVPEAA
ncbi:hypothetical protein IZ6_24750 [Terrihabitans soli]|uniref:3'-5' exoribonuclease Rv2179c-like domain-containing protein n=1 Tax=Terrihabitans soli TaxID=708113 RepID=A0A6S6QXI2_9HYPH|nr:3'-5' exonuclease [Terrihabitans soli]BCJ91740.1 hypothetical protein IZ6_24750 [Terrihabitans soli]